MRKSTESIPPYHGAYALLLVLRQPRLLKVGRLGETSFPAGIYAYTGSALGPGGLRARLGHHLRSNNTRSHWHIDYLRNVADIYGFIYKIVDKSNSSADTHTAYPLECVWSLALADLPGTCTPLPGFGSSDCRTNCAAHLVGILKSSRDDVCAVSHVFLSRVIFTLADAANCSPDEIVFMPN